MRRPPHILITRPRADAEALRENLVARGFAVSLDPMLAIHPVAGATLDLDGVQALLVTSANGARAAAALTHRRDVTVLAVGDTSAAAARAAGFERVESASGAVGDLAALARRRLDPAKGPLVHAAGAAVTGDLAAMLKKDGFAVRRAVLYEAVPAEALAPETTAALRAGRIDAALFFSPRSAGTFATLVRAAGLEAQCRAVSAYCLSETIAGEARKLPWRAVHAAGRPDQAALLALLNGSKETSKNVSDTTQDESPAAAETPMVADAAGVIAAFGGIRPAAQKLGVPVTTVQGWKDRNHIPEPRHGEILEAARRLGIDLAAGRGKDQQAPSPAPKAAPQAESARKAGPKAPRAADPEPPAAPPPPTRAARGRAPLLPALFVSVAVFVVGAATAPLWGPALGLFPDTDPAEALAARMAAVETRLAELAEGAEGSADLQALSDLSARVDIVATEMGKAVKRTSDLGTVMAKQSDRLTALERAPLGDDIGALDDRVSALEEAQLGAGGAATVVDEQGRPVSPVVVELTQRVEEQAAALERIEAEAARADALAERLAALERSQATGGGANSALVLAVAQLRTAVAGSGPFADELAAVRAVAGDNGGIGGILDELAPHAAGVPTLVDLQRRFQPMASAVVRAAAAGEEEGWLAAVRARISAAVTVRRTGPDVPGGRADAVLARAEARLGAGDLATAVEEMNALAEPMAEAAASWLAAARARLAANDALDRLQARAIVGLAPARG